MDTEYLHTKEDATYTHSQFLSTLPGKITEIYNCDELGGGLKNDIACRMIAMAIGAEAVSLLLYKGSRNVLYCAGGYIDPYTSQAVSTGRSRAQADDIIGMMGDINIHEFIAFSGLVGDEENAYREYCKCHFIDHIPLSQEKFSEAYRNLRPTEKYKQYKKHFKEEVHVIDESSLSGLFYYMLTHSNARERCEQEMKKNRWNLFQPENFLVADLANIQKRYKRFFLNLTDKMGIVLNEDGYYVGIPLWANERPIGILRVIIRKQVKIEAPEVKYDLDNETLAYEYFTRTVHCQNIALILSLHLNSAIYIQAMRQIALKDNLHNDFSNFNSLADELTEIVNCHGCFIRFSDTKQGRASIRGHSASVNAYYDYLIPGGDPYMDTASGRFRSVLKELFYPVFAEENEGRRVESVKIDYDSNVIVSISYQYFDENFRLLSSPEWKGNRMKKLLKELKMMLNTGERVFQQFDLNSIVLIPIKEREYGLVSLANTSNRPFLIKDIEMIIPVVKRIGIEMKHTNVLEAVNIRNQEAFQHGLRIIFHQLMSPVVSMRNHILNIRDGTLTPQKYKLRLEEMLDTYLNFLDMLGSHQFLFDYISKGYTTPKYRDGINFFEFVKEKVRTYQMRARAERGIEIIISQEPRPARFGVNTDPELLSHVLQSLLDNAIKYSYNHHQPLVVTANPNYAPPGTANYILVSICNNALTYEIKIENWGCPIEPGEAELIREFDRRGKNASVFAAAGSGIGLFVVREIVKTLDGELQILPRASHTTINLIFKHKNPDEQK